MAMKDAEPVVAKAGAERRRFRRVKVDLPGRLFIPSDSREARCTVSNLSPGGAAIACETVPEAGTPVVLYVDNFGRLYGIAGTRDLPVFYNLRGWFAVQGLDPRGLLSCDIAPALGVPFVGHTHNALNDARSLAAGMAALAARGGVRITTRVGAAA